MLLAIDCGNTNFKFAVFEGEKLRGAWRTASDPHRTTDDYAVWLSQSMAFKGVERGDIDGAIIASVVPDALYPLASLCSHFFGHDPMIVGRHDVKLGIEVRMDRPAVVGADRLVNAVAGHKLYGGPLIVVDFGTATSFDIVAADGGYEGGVLAPGVNLSVEAFARAAAKLPRIRVRQPERVIGKDTEPAMESGIFWGYVGLIEGLTVRIKKEYGQPMTVIATGGLAPLFERVTDAIDHIEPDLTLKGLLAIYEMNQPGGAA